ncbi:hypothetical protein CLV63_116194 [Murinocardiopsis flavida]|uniref:Pyrrolidone-carboxylate peptidase n=1 Tax=Murinocardiopsis flavida TaxID=645275 RepID=A0A2P8D9B5_9ACTN|nr:pyroglutamyl peptidase [Murinocardiopsis flavida]PSK93787.1 hypothetical protein CLV63_116194 [Murinocardiopsis flavida]
MNVTDRTAEESRAETAVPRAILLRSGFAAAERLLTAELAGAGDLDGAQQVVTSHGRRLWVEATREQSGVPDDRPLYWARLTLTAALRRWDPPFPVSDDARHALLRRLDHASRGHDDLVFPPDKDVLRVIVTGFDPFGLTEDPRAANPSGTAAIALHRTELDLPGRTAVVRSALFPVRWRDFTEGIAEHLLLPHYTADTGAADAVITVSQGRDGRFDIEAHNAAWRGPRPDNEGVTAAGPIPPAPADPAHPAAPAPQWTRTTLPAAAIIDQAGGRYPVHHHTGVTEVPAGGGKPVDRADGPTPGSAPRRGGGGDYLSNELAYRNTALRDRAGRTIPVGHVHTPRLVLGADDPAALTDAAFERDRADITAQLRAIITAALDGC